MTSTIQVLHIYKSSLPVSRGGVEVFIDSLCRQTVKEGVNNTVLSLAKKNSKTPIDREGYRNYQAKENIAISSTGFSLTAFSLFSRLADQADVIHYHFPYPFADMLHFACRIKKPSIVTYHSDIVNQTFLIRFYRPLMRSFLDSVDTIIATSLNYCQSSKVLSHYADKVKVIPIGINRYDYPLLKEVITNKWREQLPQDFFLFIGRLRYYKGLDVLVVAAIESGYPVVIAGSGNMKQLLKTIVSKSASATNQIFFLDEVSAEDKVALLALCYAFVFPSNRRSEAFGISLLEAAMFAKPLICCELATGTTYVNEHDVTGIVIPPDDANALVRAMHRLWHDPDLVARLGDNAYRRFQRLFTADIMGQAYVQQYRKISL